MAAPITIGVSPPSVEVISKSPCLKPNSINYYAPNSGLSSKSSTLAIIATSPPDMKDITLSKLNFYLYRVSIVRDSLPVDPQPNINTLPPY